MSKYVIVRIDENLIPEFQIHYNPEENIATKSNIESWSSISLENKQRLILILSANLTYTTQLKIPSKNDEVIRQSIPFVIEEELANDIDNNHYAYELIDEQNFMVSVVAKELIEEIEKQLNKHNLECTLLYSEIFTCPFHLNGSSFCILDNYVIARDNYNGTTINKSLISTYLKLADNKTSRRISKVIGGFFLSTCQYSVLSD